VRRGPDVIVAIAKQYSADLPAPPLAAAPDPELLAMRGFRRVVALPDGRIVRAPNGTALELELPGAAPGRSDFVIVDSKRVVDVALAGNLLANLTSFPARYAVWDLSGPPLALFACPDEDATSIALVATAEGPIVLTTSVNYVLATRADCSIRSVFDLPYGEPLRVVATSRLDNGWVAAGTRAGEVIVWDWDGNLRATVPLHLEPVSALTLDPSERWVASGAWDGRVRFLDLTVIDAPLAPLLGAIRDAWAGAAP